MLLVRAPPRAEPVGPHRYVHPLLKLNSVLRPKYLGEGGISRRLFAEGTFLGRPRSSLLDLVAGRCPLDHFTALRAPY
eukprot:SAG22_NODE_2707_length_2294_cov_54.614123_2_plen_78_part_00